jgi:hypothetical protein
VNSNPTAENVYWKADGVLPSKEILSHLSHPNSLHSYSLTKLKLSAGIKGDCILARPLIKCEMCNEKESLKERKNLLNSFYYKYCIYTVAQLVEVLCYKPEGRGFDSRLCHWNFSWT